MGNVLKCTLVLWLTFCTLSHLGIAEGACPSDWVPSEASGTCIRLYSVDSDWYAARAACQAEGGDLVKIVNLQMNDLIYDLAEQFHAEFAWIGLNDIQYEDTWVWLNETQEAEWTYWGAEQPDSLWGDQDCVEIDFGDNATWRDLECYFYLAYICEISSFTTSSPTTTISTTVITSLETTAKVTTENNDLDTTSTHSRSTEVHTTATLQMTTAEATEQTTFGEIHASATESSRTTESREFVTEKATTTYTQTSETTQSTSLEIETPTTEQSRATKVEIFPTPTDNEVGKTVSCLPDWVESVASQTCIKLSTDEKSWSDSRVSCQVDGGDLVKIINEEMDSFIGAETIKYGGGSYWIGLHDENKDGKFEWLDESSEATYTNWYISQPNNLSSSGLGQDCVELGFDGTTFWNDAYCDSNNNYICERPGEVYTPGIISTREGPTTTLMAVISVAFIFLVVLLMMISWHCGKRQGKKVRREPSQAVVFNNAAYSLADDGTSRF